MAKDENQDSKDLREGENPGKALSVFATANTEIDLSAFLANNENSIEELLERLEGKVPGVKILLTTNVIDALSGERLEQEGEKEDIPIVEILLDEAGRCGSLRVGGTYEHVNRVIEVIELLLLLEKPDEQDDHVLDNHGNTDENSQNLDMKNCIQNKMGASDEKHGRKNRKLCRDLTPYSGHTPYPAEKEISSYTQNLNIDEFLWHYLLFKHADDVANIMSSNACNSRLNAEHSKDIVKHSINITPVNYRSKTPEERVNQASDEFAALCQKYSPDIKEEIIKLPVELNTKKLKDELEKLNILLIRGEIFHLIGPNRTIEEGKRIIWNAVDEHNKQSKTQERKGKNSSCSKADCEDFFTFKTPGGITVHVSKGDLTHQSTDAIVNPANSALRHGGGAARAISDAAGKALDTECRDYIKQHRELKVSHAMYTSAGNLSPNIKYVIHAVGPRYEDYKDKAKLYKVMTRTFYNCLCSANKLNIASISIPAISSGIFGVPLNIVADASYEGLMEFDKCHKDKAIQVVYFLNNDDKTVHFMRDKFNSLRSSYDGTSVDHPAKIEDTTAASAVHEYAKWSNLKMIKMLPNDEHCFAKALATTLNIDHRQKLDEEKVMKCIKTELTKNKDHYKQFMTKKEMESSSSTPAWLSEFLSLFFYRDKEIKWKFDIIPNAAANALNVQLVIFQDGHEHIVTPRYNKDCRKTVHLACSCDKDHLHFDALVHDSDQWEMIHSPTTSDISDIKPGSFTSLSIDSQDADYRGASGGSDPDPGSFDNINNNDNDETKDDDDADDCIICMDKITDMKKLLCGHKFCKQCIDDCFEKCQPKCPYCGKVFGILKGTQPNGTMTTTEKKWQDLAGYNGCGSIEILYGFPDGVQKANHPNPGKNYRGTHRTAFLPANHEGREVLNLLRRAFDARLVFTIGTSNTTGRDDVVIWNDVHHKTSLYGQYGYPDPTYLKRVKDELAAKGIK